jgi:hypothetical protein
MRQILQLEPHEVARLQKGKALVITTQGGDEIGLQFLSITKNGHGEKTELVCPVCKATSGFNGPFKNLTGLSAHVRAVHPSYRAHKKGKR